MTARNNSPVSATRKRLARVEDDPTSVIIDSGWDEKEIKRHQRPHEFIVATGPHNIAFMSGVNIDLDSVIETEEETYRHCVETFHEEMADGRREPGDTLAEMIGDDSFSDLVIWTPGGRVGAVLVPRLDGSGHEVTQFHRDRSHPGPVAPVAEVKDQAAPQPKPTRAPWRSFKVDRPGGGFAAIVEGHGTTLDDAIAAAVEEIRVLSGQGLEPDGYVVIEQDRVVCHVRAADVLSESTWTEACDEDEAIAKAVKAVTAATHDAKDYAPAVTPAPESKPYSPADLPELALSLARCELRDAIDALLGARFRCNEAHTGMEGLSGAAKRIVKEIDYRADNTCTDSEYAIARTLLSIWGVTDGGVQPFDTTPPPWTPCGALVDGRYFVWTIPGEHQGPPNYNIGEALVRVVDNEDLEEDNLSDDDLDRMLKKPPCRYVRLSGTLPPTITEAECLTWH